MKVKEFWIIDNEIYNCEQDTGHLRHTGQFHVIEYSAYQKLRDALEKIADPRKRDHKEPDSYTELGCVMNIAEEALNNISVSEKHDE